jgi:multiple sugar transport system permease protein
MFVWIVLPLSKPILGVVSIFAILAEYRNFLWPYVVLFSSPEKQPISVRLIAIQSQTTLGVLMAAMLIASILPIVGFLIFQRSFIRGTGLGGALRG